MVFSVMLSIREAEEQDLLHILTLYRQPDMDGDCLELEQAKNIFSKIKSYPDYQIYVAEMDGNIIGTYTLTVLDNLVHSGAKTGIIESVVVSKAFRGQGVGKAMMMHAVELCREKKCYKAMLSSGLKRSEAHRFYESLGFKIHGVSFLMNLQ